MNFRLLKTVAVIGLLFIFICSISCGDSTNSGESTTLEILALDEGDSGEFYPFDAPPVLMSMESPAYPEEAKQSGLEGTVMVKVLVGIDGTVESVTVLEASDPIFEGAALDAATRCQFKPAKLEGQATRSYVAIPYHFKLEC